MATFNLMQGQTGPPATVGDATPINVGLEIAVSQTVWLTHVHWWQAASGGSSSARTVGVYPASGTATLLASKSGATPSGTGWQSVALDSPLQLDAGSYRVVVLHPNGQYSATAAYFAAGSGNPGASGLSNPPLTAPNNTNISGAGGQASFTESSSLARTETGFGQTNYWVDATVTDANPSGLNVSAGANQNILVGQNASLIGSATGGSGTKTYAWTKTSGPSGSFGAATSAATTFTPSGGAGTYVLRLTVTDSSGTAYAEMTLTVGAAGLTANPASAISTGWTVIGSSAVVALSDTDDGTYLQATGPSSLLLDITFGAIQAPAGGQDWTCRVWCQKLTATSGTIVGRLYNGTTLISTAPSVTIPNTLGPIDCVFPSADIASMPANTWLTGPRVTFTVSAA